MYDFNKPEEIPESLHGTFDMAVIDPPYVTCDVWIKYADALQLLLKKDETGKTFKGNLLCSTTIENMHFLKQLLNVSPIAFRPSIPNLAYQFIFYTNYEEPA